MVYAYGLGRVTRNELMTLEQMIGMRDAHISLRHEPGTPWAPYLQFFHDKHGWSPNRPLIDLFGQRMRDDGAFFWMNWYPGMNDDWRPGPGYRPPVQGQVWEMDTRVIRYGQ
ncbi:uncharacterized protein LY89DRAFT_663370 [Mollisia scopiformis]|uniref:Uncharacterized protein n=1 Tax=Mollisia scopiformis TaxID=149040 RepID=A0A194XWN6_MOLSC|nr:uncharacterized protein LY89DRAFT_663370 [Mollisia scopiformis]KUJ24648.1 hypothetical protein LY89DRAFT_663370 [Mollisia scopiformis]